MRTNETKQGVCRLLLRRVAVLSCLGLVLCMASGCYTRLDERFSDRGVFANVRSRMSFDLLFWDPEFTDAQVYVPVHPGDGGPGLGGVTPDLDGTVLTTRFGLGGAMGNKYLRFIYGADWRVNPGWGDHDSIDDFDDDGDLEYDSANMRDVDRQPLPLNFDSYGYAFVDVGDYTTIPYIGIEGEFLNFIFGLEFGAPRTQFVFEKGHYRSGVVEPLERSEWTGYGQSASMKAGCRMLDNRGFFGLQYSYEHYDAEFSDVDTDINANVVGILFELRF